MAGHGTLHLFHSNGDLCRSRSYNSYANKEKLIKLWKKLYGKKFPEMTIEDIAEDTIKVKIERWKRENKIPDYGHVLKNPNTSSFKKKY